MKKNKVRFSIVGPGRVGSSIGKALEKKGWHCSSIVHKDDTHADLRALKFNFPHSRVTSLTEELNSDFDVLLITVTDDAIKEIASRLASMKDFNWRGKIIFHFSGVVELKILSDLKRLGAHVGALHPIAPFARRFAPRRAEGTYYDFLGDREALSVARKVTKALNSKLLVLNSERERVLLHLASVIASSTVVIAMRSAESMISNFMEPKDSKMVLNRLLSSTVQNLSTVDDMEALTGPLKRGDLEVIAKHIKALENNERFLQFYKSTSLLGIDALLRNARDESEKIRLKKIEKLLEGK